MRNSNKTRQVVVILSLICLFLGAIFLFSKVDFLKATEEKSAFVNVKVDGKNIKSLGVTLDKPEAMVELSTDENMWLRIPNNEEYQLMAINEEEQDTGIAEVSQADFDLEKESSLIETKKSSKGTNTDSQFFQKSEVFNVVNSKGQVKNTYLRVMRDQPLRMKVKRNKSDETKLLIYDARNQGLKQEILKFSNNPSFQLNTEPMRLLKETDALNEQLKEENSVLQENLVEKSQISPDDVSINQPFEMKIDVTRSTGLAPFDSNDNPGYDSSPFNNVVRSFDLVNYRVDLGLSNKDDTYKAFRIRLDTKIEQAWRLDKSGKVRQTAELSNGSLVNTGNGIKKATRSSWVNLNSAAGQAFFTESVNVFGGVNRDEIATDFVLVVESATTKSGETVPINQIVNSTVMPSLHDKVFVSAKPQVDIKLAWTPHRMSNFKKTTGTDDKLYTMVTNVAAYAQLKPLAGRVDLTSIKGATYPVGGIKYKLNQNIFYTNELNNQTKELNVGKETDPMQVISYDGLAGWKMSKKNFTTEYSAYSSNFNEVSRQGIDAPYGYTRNTFPPNIGSNSYKGIFDTGNPIAKNNSATNDIEILNTDYIPASIGKNKALLSAKPMPSNAEPFSVIAMQVAYPYDYLEKLVGIPGNMRFVLSTTEVEYEGVKQAVNSQISMIWDKKWPGGITNYATFLDSERVGLNSMQEGDRDWKSNGDGRTTQNNKIWTSFFTAFNDVESDKNVMYGRWNANSFVYDSSRDVKTIVDGGYFLNVFYGIGPKSPDMSLRTREEIDKSYTWYQNVDSAQSAGEIVAVKTVYQITDSSGTARPRVLVPLKVKGIIGAVDNQNNPNIAITNSFNLKADGISGSFYYPINNQPNYKATQYSKEGVLISSHSPSSNWGDTLFIQSMVIRPDIFTDKSTYSPDETIVWTANGNVTSGAESNHKVQLAVTIPKETEYKIGTTRNHSGEVLTDPRVVVNNNGTKTLTFIQDYKAVGSTYNPTVKFETSIIASALNFVNNATQLNGKVVADVWLEEDKNIKDTSTENQRMSTTSVNVTNSGVIVIDKMVDKPFIEAGNEIDSAYPAETHPTDFKYTIDYKNHSSSSMSNVRVLDVLPFNGDGRSTTFHGNYATVDAHLVDGTGEIWYTNNQIETDTDPNSINLSNGWVKLGTDKTVLKNVKAIMAVYQSISSGEALSLTVSLRPNNQKAGDVYANSPSLNSNLNKFVEGVTSKVRVVGRDLSGIAWFDDQADGLIGKKLNGSVESFAKDIPVKLYRTSQKNTDYKKQLVKKSLTGETFIDDTGKSVVKTNTAGKYQFNNLSEGMYVVEFEAGDQVVQKKVKVTTPLIGSDEAKNSKANPETYQTKEYKQPLLEDLNAAITAEDKIFHIPHVNVGLIRPSKVSLFKYEEGTAIDLDGNGQLDEREKETGTPLANAEFDLYTGDRQEKVGTATTNKEGIVTFNSLFPGEYTLVETRAPDGHELVKKPIPFTMKEGNIEIKLYQDDAKDTVLPFTGSNFIFPVILISGTGLMIVGLFIMLYYDRLQGKQAPARRRSK